MTEHVPSVTRAVGGGVSLPLRLSNLVARLYRAWRHRRDVERLLAMDDYLLSDIGLNRYDVQTALSGPVGEDPSLHLVRARQEARRRRPFRKP